MGFWYSPRSSPVIHAQYTTEQQHASTLQRDQLRLELAASFRLNGVATAMVAITLPKQLRDTVVLSFADAKISAIQFEPSTRTLITQKLINLEIEAVYGSKVNADLPPVLQADPLHRCIGALVYGCRLVIIPAHALQPRTNVQFRVIDLEKLSSPLGQAKSFCFLTGYTTPTALLLHEPRPVWVGRHAVGRDSCVLSALSCELDTTDDFAPTVWAKDSLPSDCFALVPTPQPLGGALIVSPNMVLHTNQASSSAVAVNAIAARATGYPHTTQAGLSLNLDNARVTFITSVDAIFSLQSGQLYRIGLRSDDGTPAPKRPHKAVASRSTEDLDIYGADLHHRGQGQRNYMVHVLDRLPNLAPVLAITPALPASVSVEDGLHGRPPIDTLVTAGRDDHASLAQLYNGFRPKVQLSTQEFSKTRDVWALHVPVKGNRSDAADKGSRRSHGALILSQSSGTGVLAIRNGLKTSPINRLVTSRALFLTRGFERLAEIRVPGGQKIRSASVADPFVMTLMSDHSVHMFVLNPVTKTLDHIECTPCWQGVVKSITLCQDVSRILHLHSAALLDELKNESEQRLESASTATQSSAVVEATPNSTEVEGATAQPATRGMLVADDEDDFLYGEAEAEPDTKTTMPTPTPTVSKPGQNVAPSQTMAESATYGIFDAAELGPSVATSDDYAAPTYWALITTESGALYICTVPDLKIAFHCPSFGDGHSLVWDRLPNQAIPQAGDGADAPDEARNDDDAHGSEEYIVETLLIGLGQGQRPHLLARTSDHHLLMYEVFPVVPSVTEASVRRLKPFQNIAGCDGVCVTGPRPLLVACGHQLKAITIVPLALEDAVKTFHPLHMDDVENGFIYFTKAGTLCCATAPDGLMLNRGVLARRAVLGRTIQKIAFDLDSRLAALLLMEPRPELKPSRGNNDPPSNELPNISYRPDEPKALTPFFQLQLLSPKSMKLLPDTRIEYDLHHHVTSFAAVRLSSSLNSTGKQNYIAVGVTLLEGQRATTTGFVDFYTVDVHDGKETRLEKRASCKQPGCVSAMDCTEDGFLVAAVGQRLGSKIYVWNFQDGQELQPLAYFEAGIYTSCIRVIKNLAIVGDYESGVQLLRFSRQKGLQQMPVFRGTKHRFYSLVKVGADPHKSNCYCADFVVRESDLAMIYGDADGNLVALDYDADSPDTRGGRILVRSANFHLGTRLSAMLRLQAAPVVRAPGGLAEAQKCHVVHTFGIEGQQGVVIPLHEAEYRRLEMLQKKLVSHSSLAGLHPFQFRAFKSSIWRPRSFAQGILDGALLRQYFCLGRREQLDVAEQLGVSAQQLERDMAHALDAAFYL
ncbi:uncharacterized protein MONBRDRAFT_33188 [Monosiga brevicollis MX1]|uniref:DNA damage-binding protein 1 n=1 Tax=Monosiga brevicollis TaxID=81824 RepID=A9V3K9_MONBE|nr:uncharacterized protein MONBRDRAFT_33188 [Monosiga brevicollis MX1]EDQ87831.1 predicted protein [Monosiga brevicollis MX1]|eukprot:XP_001747364.1 hypothetical protein [Monosiga brevicollis MX1]